MKKQINEAIELVLKLREEAWNEWRKDTTKDKYRNKAFLYEELLNILVFRHYFNDKIGYDNEFDRYIILTEEFFLHDILKGHFKTHKFKAITEHDRKKVVSILESVDFRY